MYSRLAGMILHGSLNPMDEVLGRSKAKFAEAGRSVMTGRIPVGLSATVPLPDYGRVARDPGVSRFDSIAKRDQRHPSWT
jgi:hypothetical protein